MRSDLFQPLCKERTAAALSNGGGTALLRQLNKLFKFTRAPFATAIFAESPWSFFGGRIEIKHCHGMPRGVFYFWPVDKSPSNHQLGRICWDSFSIIEEASRKSKLYKRVRFVHRSEWSTATVVFQIDPGFCFKKTTWHIWSVIPLIIPEQAPLSWSWDLANVGPTKQKV